MRPFVQYYDATYSDKDYQKDNQVFRGIIKPTHRPKILEIGSGTGNQTLLIAQWADVVAVEMDADFVSVMRQKIAAHPAIQLFEGDIGKLNEDNFDGAGAFFNVINYVHGRDALLHFFRSIADRLMPGAAMVFDMWHAEAVLLDGPEETTRIKHYDNYLGKGTVMQTIVPTLNVQTRDIALDYNISYESEHGSVIPAPFVERIDMFLWLEQEMIDVLHEAGFDNLEFYDGRNYPAPMTAESWTLWVIARKRNTTI